MNKPCGLFLPQFGHAIGLIPILDIKITVGSEGEAVRRSEEAQVMILRRYAEVRPLFAIRVIAEKRAWCAGLVEDDGTRFELLHSRILAAPGKRTGPAEIGRVDTDPVSLQIEVAEPAVLTICY